MSKRLIYSALVAAVFALAVSAAVASDDDSRSGRNHFRIGLGGFQENPSISTTGTGELDLRIDDEAETIEFELSYSNLEGNLVPGGRVLAAHIHLAARGVNGGVVAFLCGGGGQDPCPQPEGTVTGTILPSNISLPGQGLDPGEPTAFEEFVRAIRAGFTYANVHTTRWGGGEIRGQITNRGRDHD